VPEFWTDRNPARGRSCRSDRPVAEVAAARPLVTAPRPLADRYDKREYQIQMRDGVKLFTAVYTPKDTSQRYPFMMLRTPYSIAPYGEDKVPDVLGRARCTRTPATSSFTRMCAAAACRKARS